MKRRRVGSAFFFRQGYGAGRAAQTAPECGECGDPAGSNMYCDTCRGIANIPEPTEYEAWVEKAATELFERAYHNAVETNQADKAQSWLWNYVSTAEKLYEVLDDLVDQKLGFNHPLRGSVIKALMPLISKKLDQRKVPQPSKPLKGRPLAKAKLIELDLLPLVDETVRIIREFASQADLNTEFANGSAEDMYPPEWTTPPEGVDVYDRQVQRDVLDALARQMGMGGVKKAYGAGGRTLDFDESRETTLDSVDVGPLAGEDLETNETIVEHNNGRVLTAADMKPVMSFVWQGYEIAIEARGGETRSPNGKYPQEVPASWIGMGYFVGLPANDGDSLDVVVGPVDDDSRLWVIEQTKPDEDTHVQWKVMLGFPDEQSAVDGFLALWPEKMLGRVQEYDRDAFLEALPLLIQPDEESRAVEAAGIVNLHELVDGLDEQEVTESTLEMWPESYEDGTSSIHMGGLEIVASPADAAAFASFYERGARVVNDIDTHKKALGRDDATYASWVPPQFYGELIVAVHGLMTNGRAWAHDVIKTRAIPPKQHKAVEMAARLFSVANLPKDKYGWFKKNQKRLQLLVEAASWPERRKDEVLTGDLPNEEVFRVGGFEVHNTVGASGAALENARAIIDSATRAVGTLGVPALAYGTLYLVGQIERKNWAAWYKPQADEVYLRPALRGVGTEESARHLAHELGHRYWHKHMSDEAKKKWGAHHTGREYGVGDAKAPLVERYPEGTELDMIVNKKRPVVLSYVPGGVMLGDVATKEPIGKVDFQKFIQWTSAIDKQKRFPSPYSAQSKEEHFAESFSFLAFGRLTPEHAAPLLEVLALNKTAAAAIGELGRQLESLKPALAQAAQEVLDAWQPSEDGDDVYGGGGVCDDVARAMSDVLGNIDASITEGGQDGDDHAYLVVYNDTEAYEVDIPPGVYETGGGYSWKKIDGVVLDATDVIVHPIPRDWISEDDFLRDAAVKTALPKWKEMGVELPDVAAQLEPYVDAPGVFFTMTDVEKVGINPKSGYNTPNGIYTYPLDREYFELWKVGKLPFVGDKPYINVFKTDGAGIIDVQATKYSEADLARDIEKIKTWRAAQSGNAVGAKMSALENACWALQQGAAESVPAGHEDRALAIINPAVEQILHEARSYTPDTDWRIFYTLHNELEEDLEAEEYDQDLREPLRALYKAIVELTDTFRYPKREVPVEATVERAIAEARQDFPFGLLWNITREVSGNPNKWNGLLRSLGIEGVVDNGDGLIHPNEPKQAVFLSTSGLSMIGRFLNPQRQERSTKRKEDADRVEALLDTKDFARVRAVMDRVQIDPMRIGAVVGNLVQVGKMTPFDVKNFYAAFGDKPGVVQSFEGRVRSFIDFAAWRSPAANAAIYEMLRPMMASMSADLQAFYAQTIAKAPSVDKREMPAPDPALQARVQQNEKDMAELYGNMFDEPKTAAPRRRVTKDMRVPQHDFSKADYDNRRDQPVKEQTVRDDYGVDPAHRVYQDYIPLADLNEQLAEGEGGKYDWAKHSPEGVYPPIKVHYDETGPYIHDGNHRVRYWKERGFTHAPAWVVDERKKQAAGLIDVNALANAIAKPLGEAVDEVADKINPSDVSAGFDFGALVPEVIQNFARNSGIRFTGGGFFILNQLSGIPESNILKSHEAQNRFGQTRFYLDVNGEEGQAYFLPPNRSEGVGSIHLYIAPLIYKRVRQGLNSFSAIRELLTHELRHAADWAYQPGQFDRVNSGGADNTAYYNSPTELASYAGNVADRVWRAQGLDWREMSGADIFKLAQALHSRVFQHLDETNKKQFLQRVMKGLEQLERENTRLTTPRAAAAASTTWFHGDTTRRTSFDGQQMDRPRHGDPNAVGPGIYFTSDKTLAAGYAGHGGFVYSVRVNGEIVQPNTKATSAFVKSLIDLAPPESREIGLSNYDEDPTRALRAAMNGLVGEDFIDAAVLIYHEFFQWKAAEFTAAMTKLGYAGYFIPMRDGVNHLVVWDPKAVQIVDEEPAADFLAARDASVRSAADDEEDDDELVMQHVVRQDLRDEEARERAKRNILEKGYDLRQWGKTTKAVGGHQYLTGPKGVSLTPLNEDPGNVRGPTVYSRGRFANPLVVTTEEKAGLPARFGGATGARLARAIMKAGHDAVYVTLGGDLLEVIALDPSMLSNHPTYEDARAPRRRGQIREAGKKTLERLLQANPNDEAVLRELGEKDPTPNYDWLEALYRWVKAGATPDDAVTTANDIDRFSQVLKAEGKGVNPHQYKTLNDARSAIEALKAAGQRPRLRKQDAKYEIVHQDSDLTIYRADNKEAACVLGSDSDWCSAKWGREFWESRITMYGGNTVYIGRFQDGRGYMLRVDKRGAVKTAFDLRDNDVFGSADPGYVAVTTALHKRGLIADMLSLNADELERIIAVLREHGYTSRLEELAQEWTSYAFTAGQVDSILDDFSDISAEDAAAMRDGTYANDALTQLQRKIVQIPGTIWALYGSGIVELFNGTVDATIAEIKDQTVDQWIWNRQSWREWQLKSTRAQAAELGDWWFADAIHNVTIPQPLLTLFGSVIGSQERSAKRVQDVAEVFESIDDDMFPLLPATLTPEQWELVDALTAWFAENPDIDGDFAWAVVFVGLGFDGPRIRSVAAEISATDPAHFAEHLIEPRTIYDYLMQQRHETQRRGAVELTNAEVRAWAEEVKSTLGLLSFEVYLRGDGALKLDSIVVPKNARNQGIGTKAIEALNTFADEHDLRVILQPGAKDDFHGTTSRNRLVRFYKDRGFTENKGRKKDFTISEGMYRDPRSRRGAQHQPIIRNAVGDSPKEPWQLTFKEYIEAIGGNKTHPSDAYEGHMATPFFDRPSTVIDSQELPDGRVIEYRRSDVGERLRDGSTRREKSLFAVLDGWIIGQVQDEWGTTLVRVDPDFRSFGIGARLTFHTRREWPDRPSGGMTPQGYGMNRRVHKMMVQDALARGEEVPPEVLAEYPSVEPAAMPERVPESGEPTSWEAPQSGSVGSMKNIEDLESWERDRVENYPQIRDVERMHKYPEPIRDIWTSMGKPLETYERADGYGPGRPSYGYSWPKGQPTYQEVLDFFKSKDLRPDKHNQYQWYKPQLAPDAPKRPMAPDRSLRKAQWDEDDQKSQDFLRKYYEEQRLKKGPQRTRDKGRYDFDNMDLLCVCGHKLGVHLAEQPRDCDNLNWGDGTPCACAGFKRVRMRTAQRQPTVAIDMDGTILEEKPGWAQQGILGPPLPGAMKALRELESLGWKILIHTARFWFPDRGADLEERIASHLRQHGIPFHEIATGPKPPADFYVDNKAVAFDGDWNAVLQTITQIDDGAADDGGDGSDERVGLIEWDEGENDFGAVDEGERRDRAIDRPPDLEGILH